MLCVDNLWLLVVLRGENFSFYGFPIFWWVLAPLRKNTHNNKPIINPIDHTLDQSFDLLIVLNPSLVAPRTLPPTLHA